MRDAGATRAKLLKAAMEVFMETGYAGATTRAIAKRAHVNEVTLFRHFGAKADLLVEALAGEAAKLIPQAIRYTGDIEADLVHLVRTYQKFATTRAQFVATVLSDVPRFPELKPATETPRRIFAAAAVMLGQYQRQGLLAAEPVAITAASLLAPVLLLALAHRAAPDVASAAIDPEEHVRRFLAGHGGALSRSKAKRRRAT